MYTIKKSLFLIFLFHQSFEIEILCPCDVSGGLCDLLCCCDTDCSVSDLDAFKCQQKTQEPNQKGIVKACVPNSLIFTSNTPYIINTASSLFCVEYKEIKLSTDNTNVLINQTDFQNYFLNQPLISLDLNKTFFDISDYVWVVNDQNQISYLTSQKSNDLAPFHYLKNRFKEFVIDLNKFNDSDILFETTMFDYFKIINNPQFSMNCSNLTNLYDSCSSLIVINKNCSFNNSIQDCALFNSIPNTLFISSYKFIIEYSNPDGIKSAMIVYEFLEKALFNNSQYFTQNFKLEFKNTKTILSEKNFLSYNIGSPIHISDFNQTDTISIKIFNSASNCDQNLRIPVQFGKNMATECFITVEKLSDLIQTCKKIGDKIKNIQLENGIFLNYVASYKDLIKYDPNDEWVKVENLFTGSTFEAIFDSCDQMATGLNIQIAYAKVGNALKPLNKILKVKYQWLQDDIKLKCFNALCNDRVKVSTYVTFVDVTLTAKLEEAKIYSQSGIVSNDFFAPFINFSSKLKSSNLKFIFITFYFYKFFAFH